MGTIGRAYSLAKYSASYYQLKKGRLTADGFVEKAFGHGNFLFGTTRLRLHCMGLAGEALAIDGFATISSLLDNIKPTKPEDRFLRPNVIGGIFEYMFLPAARKISKFSTIQPRLAEVFKVCLSAENHGNILSVKRTGQIARDWSAQEIADVINGSDMPPKTAAKLIWQIRPERHSVIARAVSMQANDQELYALILQEIENIERGK